MSPARPARHRARTSPRRARTPPRRALPAVLALAAALGGCTALPPVQPWEKGVLARPAMGFEPDRLEAAFAEHTYASKEGAAGTAAAGAGGCGCN